MTSQPDPTPGPVAIDKSVLGSVAEGTHWDPHGVLGPHLDAAGVTIRALRPLADTVTVQTVDASVPMEHEFNGIWVAFLPGATEIPDYRLCATYGTDTITVDDPYRHLPTISDFDLHLIGEGRHETLWQALGANVRTFDSELGEVAGTAFAVWAPNARAVRLVCDSNHWQGRGHTLRSLGSSGVWELFVPGVGPGERYKFEIQQPDGAWRQKADPMAKGTQVPPENASVVVASQYEWSDDAWLTRRSESNPHNQPMSVYEVHLGSWRPGLGYRELADQLTDYVDELGFTHVEFLPVAEHPFGGSWGYQVTSYYAPTSRFGHPDDFRYLVDTLHQRGIGVIVDWVPAHFPKDEWALGRFDGTALYEDPDPRRGEHPDWGTYIFNFGRAEVRNFLVANANYWFEEFHIDGLRVDAVASMLYLDYSRTDGQWTPNAHGGRENLEAIAFMQEANATAYRRNPGIMMIAEESTAYPGVTAPTDAGGLGFGFKWNMGWMNDSLRYFQRDPIHRPYHHDEITFSLVYAFSEQFVLPFSHDEVVHGKGSLYGKMPGDDWQKRANLRAVLAYQWTHPGAPLLFMGQEFGQQSEWSETDGLAWHDADSDGGRGIARLVGDLNNLLLNEPALWQRDHTPDGFRWLAADGIVGNSLGYLRLAHDEYPLAVIINVSGQPLENYRIGLPHAGGWDEILNTDAPIYGGSGVGNLGHIRAEDLPWDGQPASAKLRIPPLGAVIFKPDGE